MEQNVSKISIFFSFVPKSSTPEPIRVELAGWSAPLPAKFHPDRSAKSPEKTQADLTKLYTILHFMQAHQ